MIVFCNFFKYTSINNFVRNGTREQNYNSLLISNRKLVEYNMRKICDYNFIIAELATRKFLVTREDLHMIVNPYITR